MVLANGTISAISNGTVVIKDATNNIVAATGLAPGTYTVYATNAGCSATPVVIAITEPAVLAALISGNVTVTYGTSASFTVTVAGSVSYQWQEQVGAGFFTNISNDGVYSGATSATLTLTNPAVAMSTNKYRCVVNGACTATSGEAILTVNPKAITVTAAAGQSKVFGSPEPTFAYTPSQAAPFTGALGRVAGENVGTYSYTLGTLAAGLNYSVTLVDTDTFAITKANATVIVNSYNGGYDGATGTATGIGGVDLSAGLNLGATFRDVPGGTANWSFNGGTNYNSQSGSVAVVISKRPIIITADAKTKVSGQIDPPLTYQVTTGSLVIGDAFSGTLNRVAGESVGTYAIQENTVALNGNYNVSYVSANLTITAATQSFGIIANGNETLCLPANPANITLSTPPSGGTGTFNTI